MSFTGTLLPYQVEAVDMMIERQKVLVAYGLGLGKTVLTIAAIEHLMDAERIRKPGLIICLASLKYQWADAIHEFTGGTRQSDGSWVGQTSQALVIDGTPAQRSAQYAAAMGWECDYTILSYQAVVNDFEQVSQLPRGFAVCDEATAIKHFRSQRSRRVKELTAPFRYALTGTPIENGKPEELYCADAKTEVLSTHGWLRHDQLGVGDKVLTLNHNTGRSEWQPVQAVNEFIVQDQDMVLMEHTSHSSLTTPNHRWPVERWRWSGGRIAGRRRTWATSDAFRWGDRVPIAAECSDLVAEAKYTDALVELVAWFYTEGHIRKRRDGSLGTAVNITQNTSAAVNVSRIRSALTSILGLESGPFPRTGQQVDGVPRWREDHDGGRSSVFKLNTSAGAHILTYAPNRVPSHDFLLSLTEAQLALFIEVSMLADNNGEHCFSQKESACAEAFQLACILAGHATSIRPSHKVDYDRNGNPYRMTTVCVRRQRYFSPGQSPRLGKSVRYTGTVWCPTTANGTWLARREGSVYFTGNSIMQWVDPKVLGRFDLFDTTFIKRDKWGGVERYRNLRTFNKVLMTACVRKGQDDPDVAPYLPAVRTMTPIRIPFDARGAKLYNRICADLLADLAQADDFMNSFSLEANYGIADSWAGAEEMGLRGAIMAKLTCLRMLCDHPRLLSISAGLYDNAAMGVVAGSAYASELASAGLLRGLKQTPKFDVVVRYVKDFLDADETNKVVLFSYFKATLSMLQEYLGECHIDSALYTGDLSAKEKEANKRRFQTDPNCRVLLSSDAGGYGVDLPQANLLVNYDLPWTPGTAKQRNGRIRRASSTFPFVVIQDMLMRGSIEERQWEALQVKDSVASAILDGKGVDARGSLTLTLASLASFLRESSVT